MNYSVSGAQNPGKINTIHFTQEGCDEASLMMTGAARQRIQLEENYFGEVRSKLCFIATNLFHIISSGDGGGPLLDFTQLGCSTSHNAVPSGELAANFAWRFI